MLTNGAYGWRGIGEVSIIDENNSSIGILTKVNSVETAVCGAEFNDASCGMNFKDAVTVGAVICYPEFLTQLIER